MCQGGIDPKYGLRELENSFKAARQSAVKSEEKKEPVAGLWGWATALIARLKPKEMTHG